MEHGCKRCGACLGAEGLGAIVCAQAADAAKSVVQIAYDIGGGTSVYESVQRYFRDTYAAVQHVQVQGGNFETCGRILLGLEPGAR